MYIDGDTHYWPLRFIDKVKHPGKGHLEVVEDKGDMVRYGEVVPGKVATYYRDGKKVHSFKEGRWSISLRAEFMKKDGFDMQVLIPDNRPLIYECDAELGRQLARAYNDTVAEDIQGDDRFIGCAWIYLPDIKESVKELRRAVKELGLKAVKFNGGWGDGDLDSEVLFPLYEEIADLNIPISAPSSGACVRSPAQPSVAGRQRTLSGLSTFSHRARLSADLHGQRARLIFGGVLDRFPTLKFGFFEGGIGWVPWLMHTLDAHMPNERPGFRFCPAIFRRQKCHQKNAEPIFRSVLHRLRLLGNLHRRHHQRLAQPQYYYWQRLRPRRRRRHLAAHRRCDQADEEFVGRHKEKVLGGNAMRMFGLNGNGAGKH